MAHTVSRHPHLAVAEIRVFMRSLASVFRMITECFDTSFFLKGLLRGIPRILQQSCRLAIPTRSGEEQHMHGRWFVSGTYRAMASNVALNADSIIVIEFVTVGRTLFGGCAEAS